MAIVGFKKLETLFRRAASLDIKKNNAKEITDFVEQKLVDLLRAGERSAKMNARNLIVEADLPITNGLQESIIEFRKLEEALDLEDILKFLTTVPPLKYPISEELEQKLVEITGALLLIMARIMKEVDDNDRALDTKTIEKTKRIMNLSL